MKYISYILLRFVVFIFSLLPFPILYLFSDILRFFLKNIFRYRLSVIQKNIDFCFQDKSSEEKQKIINAFYKSFIDVILESIKGLSYDPNKLIERFKIRNPEILKPYFEKSQSVIIYSQHYNNWEWGPICLGLQVQHHIVGIVKKLSNPLSNAYIIEGRSGNNVSVIYTYQAGDLFKSLEGKTQAIVFIADQMPYGKTRFLELDFMGRKAKFHKGAADYACMAKLPVFSFDVHRIKRGVYELDIHLLESDVSNLNAETLTVKYRDHLEELIAQSPHSWLWSHKRFKGVVDY